MKAAQQAQADWAVWAQSHPTEAASVVTVELVMANKPATSPSTPHRGSLTLKTRTSPAQSPKASPATQHKHVDAAKRVSVTERTLATATPPPDHVTHPPSNASTDAVLPTVEQPVQSAEAVTAADVLAVAVHVDAAVPTEPQSEVQTELTLSTGATTIEASADVPVSLDQSDVIAPPEDDFVDVAAAHDDVTHPAITAEAAVGSTALADVPATTHTEPQLGTVQHQDATVATPAETAPNAVAVEEDEQPPPLPDEPPPEDDDDVVVLVNNFVTEVNVSARDSLALAEQTLLSAIADVQELSPDRTTPTAAPTMTSTTSASSFTSTEPMSITRHRLSTRQSSTDDFDSFASLRAVSSVIVSAQASNPFLSSPSADSNPFAEEAAVNPFESLPSSPQAATQLTANALPIEPTLAPQARRRPARAAPDHIKQPTSIDASVFFGASDGPKPSAPAPPPRTSVPPPADPRLFDVTPRPESMHEETVPVAWASAVLLDAGQVVGTSTPEPATPVCYECH